MDIDMSKKSKKLFKKKSKNKKVVMVSGGFDPVHIGHVRLFNEAKKMGNELIVYINNDNWLRKKKGYVFMPEHDRKEIIQAFEAVDKVIISNHTENPEDMSVCMGLMEIKPHIFANGGDRDEKDADNPNSSLYKERQIHKQFNIEMIYNVGHGGKVRSSSELVKNVKIKNKKIK